MQVFHLEQRGHRAIVADELEGCHKRHGISEWPMNAPFETLVAYELKATEAKPFPSLCVGRARRMEVETRVVRGGAGKGSWRFIVISQVFAHSQRNAHRQRNTSALPSG